MGAGTIGSAAADAVAAPMDLLLTDAALGVLDRPDTRKAQVMKRRSHGANSPARFPAASAFAIGCAVYACGSLTRLCAWCANLIPVRAYLGTSGASGSICGPWLSTGSSC